ncbi:MAG: MurR/RpiR family transcriptional regulator [Gemmiger sp.]|nr:MurR/RpiR family transcriptional regulator [Gemmiger sp.]
MNSVLVRLREAKTSLSNTERSIAACILANPEQVMQLTVRELAEQAFASPSSVVRVCRSVGFAGYREFRSALTYEIAQLRQAPAQKQKEIERTDSMGEIMDKITDKNILSLEDTRNLLSEEALSESVRLLVGCKTVLLYGIGSSLCVARDAYLKFLRLNKPCILNDDWHSQLLQARNATPQDVGIIFSYSGETVEMISCMQAMHQNGTPCIAVTRYAPSPVARLADIQLYIAANESIFRNGAMSSRISQLNVIDILYTAFANTQYDYCLRQLSKTHILKPGESGEETP